MTRKIVLLSEREEAGLLLDWLAARAPQIDLARAVDEASLRAAVADDGARTRLIAFVTGVIAPRDVLEALGPEPYNVHPGPPEYRGSHADSFAIYEGATSFGVTGHAMTAEVDAGEIVFAKRFPLPPDAERLSFAAVVLANAIEAFAAIAKHCAASDEPMRRAGEIWRGPARTRRAFRDLCAPPASADQAELDRRSRACGPDFRPCAEAAADSRGGGDGDVSGGVSPCPSTGSAGPRPSA